MSEQLRRQLEWFLRNLNLLIEDYELETQGIEVALYFDTVDVVDMTLGVQSFYYAGNFDVQEIQMAFQTQAGRPLRDRLLVLCLAFSGRLGKINLLPPHQSEFLDLLNKDFHVDNNLPANQMVRQFLQAVSRAETVKQEMAVLREISSIKDVSDEQALRYAREHAGKHAASAINFYKIIQLLRGVTWKDRLLSLREEVLELKPYGLNYDELISSRVFQTLYDGFKSKRERFWPSNFADAVALTVLVNCVESINEDGQCPIPRFFVSSKTPAVPPLFLEVLESTNMMDSLKYNFSSPQGETKLSTVLRNADYFVFKSTFQPHRYNHDSEDTGEFTDPQELYELREKISNILETPSSMTPDNLDEIIVSGKRLKQVLEELNTLLFFKNVWLPSSKQDVEIVIEDLRNAANELKSEVLQRNVDERIQEFKASLVENAIEYEKIKLIWRQMEEAAKFLERRWRERIPYQMDYLRDFGLLRFSFPEKSSQRIRDVLDDLLNGANVSDRSAYINIVTASYLAQMEKPDSFVDDIKVNDLIAAAAVLWVARMYERLADLLSKVNPLPHYSLEVIYAAALIEMYQEDENLPRVLENLEEKYLKTVDAKERAELAVGLAYVKFHLWKKFGYGPLWDRTDNKYKNDAQGTELINNAITLAFEAWKSIGEWDKKKEIYALNQYLYYLVMEGNESKLQDVHTAAGALLGKRRQNITELWQHRFDDSLAHYHHWLALLETTEEDWERNMGTAEYYAREASNKAPWDKETITNLHIIQNQLRQGFKEIKNNN